MAIGTDQQYSERFSPFLNANKQNTECFSIGLCIILLSHIDLYDLSQTNVTHHIATFLKTQKE